MQKITQSIDSFLKDISNPNGIYIYEVATLKVRKLLFLNPISKLISVNAKAVIVYRNNRLRIILKSKQHRNRFPSTLILNKNLKARN